MPMVRILAKETIAAGTVAFRFEKPSDFEFVAGQHIEVKLPWMEGAADGGNSHIFSIASSPKENFLMAATRMTGSKYKNELVGARDGTEVEINGPWGDFVLHKDASKPAVFLIGGIGITPARSIVKDAIESGKEHDIYLFYSNRKPEDAAFHSDFLKFDKESDKFHLIETMTNMEGSEEEWDAETGYIDEDMIRRYVDEPLGCVYYIAGPPAMVKAMRELLEKMGVDDIVVRTEEFSGY